MSMQVTLYNKKLAKYPNFGTYWTVGEMSRLSKLMSKGYDVNYVSNELGRTPASIVDRWRLVRLARLITNGNPEDTLTSNNLGGA